MRTIHVSAITDAVKKLCMDANYELEPDMLWAFDRALGTERSPAGRQVLQILKEGFPAIVINDCRGGDLYEDGMKQYSREPS